jgi:amino acid transporter
LKEQIRNILNKLLVFKNDKREKYKCTNPVCSKEKIMRKFNWTELWIWLLASIFSPIVVPVCFALLINIVISTGKDLMGMIEMIWLGGAYIFLSLFVLLSLLPHFFDISQQKRKISITLVYILVTVVVLLITCLLYFSFLPFIEGNSAVKFSDNSQLSMGVTILGIVIAVFYKAYFILEKVRSNNNTSNQDIRIID